MDINNNNPYQRSYKTKTEQYKEKLKQRSNSQDWLFGNIFGKPGGGAPLRDNKGNIISQLKTINDNNIFKHEANYFTKGNNNIKVLNNKIYDQNNLVSTPDSTQNKQIPIFTPRNQSISFQDRRNNNLMLQNNNLNPNYNINSLSLNQRQIPFRYIIPVQNIIPLNQLYPLQINNNFPNYNKHIATTPSMNNNLKIATPSINYINKSQNISNNNSNNIKKEDFKNDNSLEVNDKNINESEENILLISNDNDKFNRMQSEKKLEEWKNDLKEQMEEQKKRKEEAKRKEAEMDKEEEIKYKEYLAYKSKQAEENKKNKSKWKKNRNQQSQNQSNIEIEKTNNMNELEQSQKTNNNNVNDVENLDNNEFEDEPYSQNNPLNKYNIPPEMLKEQENLKNFIDNQYDSLGEILGKNIQGEIEKLSSQLTQKYEPFTNEENSNLNSIYKYSDTTAQRNNKRMEKMQDIYEERDLLNFIIGKDDNSYSTNSYQNYDIKKYYNMSSKMPSCFGKNIMPYESENNQLKSEGRFIYGDFAKNKKSQNESKYIFSENERELKYSKKNYDNYYLNNMNKKFGKNKNENMNSQSLEFSQSLDNKSSFIPLDKNEEQNNNETKINNNNDNNNNINKNNLDLNYPININKIDKVEQNIINGLKDFDELNKNVILYNKDGSTIQSFSNDNNNLENNAEVKNEINEEIKNDQNNENKINYGKDEDKLENSIINNQSNLIIEKEGELSQNDNVSD